MKKQLLLPVVSLVFGTLLTQVSVQSQQSATWTKHKAKKWFNKKDWLNGAAFTPHTSIDKTEFARQYHANKTYWDKAFAFLKEHDLNTLVVGKYPIDGTNVFATVTEDPSKDLEKTQWESHRKYIDLQCVITGEERMGKYPFAKLTVTKPYDEIKDVANYSGDGKIYDVPSGTFMIFFPSDAHRPNITPGGNKLVKKIVIKILALQ
jgi:YhcH/YjgK/YiaL family protein